jgi:hypothetical protein
LPSKGIKQKHEVFKVSFFRGSSPEAMVFLKKINSQTTEPPLIIDRGGSILATQSNT